MKKLLIALCALLAFPVMAARYTTVPPYKIVYTDNGITYTVVNLLRTSVVPYGSSHTIEVRLTNNKITNWNPKLQPRWIHQSSVSNDDGTYVVLVDDPSRCFTTDGGCNEILPIGSTCIALITFTPPNDTSDGIVHAYDDNLAIYNSLGLYKYFTLEGLAQ